MQSQNFVEVSLEERQRLRKKMPKGFNSYLSNKLNIKNTTVCKWFKNDFNSSRLHEEVKKLAGE